jgi:formylglycine-generating enzyme
MLKKSLGFFIIISFLILAHCGIFEPEKPKGSLSIIITKAELAKLSETSEQLASVFCIVKKGDQDVFNENLSKQGNSFSGEIDDLNPADNYSVLLYGKNTDAEIIARGLKSGISVRAGKQTAVSLSWNSFTPTLMSPADESVIDTDPMDLVLDWSDVNGAVEYQLIVAKDSNFESTVVGPVNFTNSTYELNKQIPNGSYYWHVRCKDAEGNWGGWSEVFRFMLSRAALSVHPVTLDFGDNEISKTFTINNSGAGTLTWQIINNNGTWISVNPTNGAITTETETVTVTVDRTGLSAGNYSGTFWVKSNIDSQLVTINLTVPQGPTLSVHPKTLDFEANESDKTFSITNTGSGTLTWEVSADSGWINVNPKNGTTTTETDHIGVTIDRTGLTPGHHTGHIFITSDGGSETVTVNVSVPEEPTFIVNPRAIDFGTTETTKTFTITNPSMPQLNWAIYEDSNWLTVNPTSGSTTTETDQLTVTVDRSDLSPGNYATHISINNNFSLDPAKVSVSMSVPEEPILSVNPTSLDFGDAETSKTFTISNTGTGTLTWDITDDSNWITVNPTSSVSPTETDQITVTVNRAGLSSGDYRGTVSITSNGGDESVTVKMSVSEEPILTVYPSTLDFGPTDATKPFVIKNSGNGTLTWEITDDRVWIAVNPTTGSTRNDVDTIAVTVNRGVISTIRGSGTVTITSNGGTETVTINYDNENDPYAGMVFVPAGEFKMGSDSGESDEQPVHSVHLDEFYIDKYEVTNLKYAAYLNEALADGEIGIVGMGTSVTKDGKKLIDLEADGSYCQISYDGGTFVVDSGKENYPVIEVTWYGADAYAKHYGKRLPSEAEWEYAARGGSLSLGYTYSGSNNVGDVAWYSSNSNGHTYPVGQKQANELGMYDMSGNVVEWCADWYSIGYYSSSPTNNPQGPASGTYRVLRGGSWYVSAYWIRCASRQPTAPSSNYYHTGFRCVR